VENQLAAQKADHQRYVRENEELTRRLKKFVERLDNDKSDLFQQLLEEKRLSCLLYTLMCSGMPV